MRFLLQKHLLLPLLLLLSAFSSGSHALTPPRGGLPGGWTPIADLKDPHIREIAEFAVCQHDEQEMTNLTLIKVVKGESQVVAGTNYRLLLRAKDGLGESAQYEVVVWEKPWQHFLQLTFFHKLVKVGGWTPIESTTDPHVCEIAEFAVAAHNEEAKSRLTLVNVVKGETQVVAGTKYRLVLKARDHVRDKPAKYQAVVWEKAWLDFRQLISFCML